MPDDTYFIIPLHNIDSTEIKISNIENWANNYNLNLNINKSKEIII